MANKTEEGAFRPIAHTTCVFCDGGCPVGVEKDGDGTIRVKPLDPEKPAICSKALMWEEYQNHPQRVVHPLKNVGTREEPVFERISWDDALDEIAERLSGLIEEFGPETLAVSEMPVNLGFGGVTRRFMNYLGTPNYFTPVLLCMGNTAQVHRAVYGWYTATNWDAADLVVYFGQDRGPEQWPVEYLNLKAVLDRGGALIEVDPRVTKTAKLATEHLRINYGTDAALLLAWINVVIEEGLYDEAFVRESTIGFEELAEHVRPLTPAWAAGICGVDEDAIRRTARMYARASAPVFPWGVTLDMQMNSTAALHAQCILRAICGNLNKSEMVYGPGTGATGWSELSDYAVLPPGQRAKQLGVDAHPLMSFKCMELYDEVYADAGYGYTADIMASSCVAHPPAVFRAMRGEGPYPVKAFFSVANNTVMSYADQQGMVEGMLNLDLLVAFDHWLTPTAQLAHYVLPSDAWMERDFLGPVFDVAPIVKPNQAFSTAPGECKNWYFVVKGLADRLGIGEAFPWEDCHELYDAMLAPQGLSWKDAEAHPAIGMKARHLGKFLTPSGKVELKSSVLEQLGCDPLPVYRPYKLPEELAAKAADYPFEIFAGGREVNSYNTNHHQMPRLRERLPEPQVWVNPADAVACGLADGAWAAVETLTGTVELQVKVDEAQPEGTLRVPHGWWKPEEPIGVANGLSGAMRHNDAVLFPDEPYNLDYAQGLPNLRGGVRAKLSALA